MQRIASLSPPDGTSSGPEVGADAGVSSIDVIIDLYKRDVDRTLIVEQLKKTPAQRAEDLERFHNFVLELRRAATKASSE